MNNQTVDISYYLEHPDELEELLEQVSPEYQREIKWLIQARPKQILPAEGWSTCILRAGRGFGKSYTASQWVRHKIEIEGCMTGLVIGSTTAKVNDILVEGESGILAVCPDAVYKSKKAQIWWPNGAKVFLQTAEKKEGARGYSVEFVVGDEMAEWPYQKTTWQHIVAAVREKGKGGNGTSQKLITSTPRRSSYMAEIEKKENCIVVTGTTFENKDNLTKEYLDELEDQWGGTSMYRQEVLGEILQEIDGALFQSDWIANGELPELEFDKGVISIDPAVSVSENSDETGIIVIGKIGNRYFVLGDHSGKYRPGQWAAKAVALQQLTGFTIVVEKNQGGDLVKTNIQNKDPYARVKPISAINSKPDRIAAAAIFYEKGEVIHCLGYEGWSGNYKLLEEAMLTWTEDDKDSPDRLDALSHGLRWLSGKNKRSAQIVVPKSNRVGKNKRKRRLVR